jgi:TonB-linked SusC/RagA family outer membrane protein
MNLLTSSKQLLFVWNNKKSSLLLTSQIVKAMKLSFVFLTLFLMQVSAKGISQKVTLSLKDAPVERVFREIEKQTGYGFLFSKKMFRNAPKVNINVKDVPLNEALQYCFKGQPLDYSIENNTIVITQKTVRIEVVEEAPLNIRIQISGRVTDKEGNPLAGVSVVVIGTDKATSIYKGTSTNSNGVYSLPNVDEDAKLKFSFVGYTAQTISVKGRSEINVSLEVDVKQQSEIVVIGYGTVKRKDLTGSVSSINTEEIKNVPFTSVDQALAGKASGVQVIQSDGSPGGATRIRIRGGASLLGNNDPLYIIDGIPVNVQNKYVSNEAEIANPVETYYGEDFNTVSGTFARGLNGLAGLNINDIASIDILKDASSTAIYGSKAANGVVIITTKKGKQNTKPVLALNYYAGITSPLKEKVLNAEQYKMIMKEAATNLNTERARVGRTPNATATNIVNDPNFFGTANTDWLGLVLRNGFTQNADISVSGGGSGSRYYTSIAYTNQTGTLIGTDFNRISGKVNLDNEITSRLRVITNLDYGFTKNNITNGIYSHALFAPPTESPYNADGSFSNFGLLNTAYQGYQNPLALASGINLAKNTTLLGSLTAEYDILKDLKFRSVVSVNYGTYNQLNYVPSYVKINSFYGAVSSNGGTGGQANTQSLNSFFENTLTWDKEFNADNRLNLLAGTSWEKYRESFFSASGAGYPDDNFLNNLNSAAVPVSVKGSNPSRQNSLLSFYVRANYSFKEKYFVTFTGRSDQSSKFDPSNQTGYFPSGALAWRISQENFLKNSTWIDELKLRVSAGLTGTQNIGDHLFRTLFTPVAYAGTNALIPSQLGNDKIKWEQTLQKDIALDYAFFKGRLRGTFGYYEKTTDGLLLNVTTAPSSSFDNVILNIAKIRNRGLEIDIRGDVVKLGNFTWNAGLNISKNVSKVLDIQGGPFSNPNDRDALNLGTSIVKEGEPLGLLYGRVSEGIFRSQKELDDYKAAFSYASIFAPYLNIGDQKFQLDSNGLAPGIAFYSNDVIGNATPDFYGGFTNIFSYKNIELTTLFTFSYGNDLIYQADVANGTVDNLANRGVAILDRYTPQNTNTNRPRLIYSSQFRPLSNDNVYDASYIKLKSVSLSYTLPKKIADHLKLRNTSFYLSGTNLFTITSYPGLDPEVSDDPNSIIGGGRDISSYPTSRSYTLGIRLGL